MILPLPKQHTTTYARCILPDTLTCSAEGALAAGGADAFTVFADCTQVPGNGFVRFVCDDTLEDKPEIYSVTVEPHGITVAAKDARGMVNGAATAALLLKKDPVPCGSILDWPDFSYRSYMIDMARGLPDPDEVRHNIRCMALAKYNRLHLHLMDSEGICYRSDAIPGLGGQGGSQCSKAELTELIELCRRFAITVVPEIEIPAHAHALTRLFPDFACQYEGDSGWALCTGNDDIWPVFTALLSEIAELFPGEYIHIGSDELEFSDVPELNCFCRWDDCPRCAALRKREGLHNKREQFYYTMQRVYAIVTALGKKMMMWNDQIDIAGDVPLPRDILIQFWRVAGKGRGPVEGCSMAEFIRKGFTVFNAWYPYAYVDLEDYLSLDTLKSWSPLTAPEHPEGMESAVIGGEMCAWEFGNTEGYPFYPYVAPAAIALFGDKLWNGSDREYDAAYRSALSEYLFGFDGTEGLPCDIFAPVGSILPPRDANRLTYSDGSGLTPSLIAALSDALAARKTPFHAPTIDAYLTLFARIAASLL